MYSGHLQISAVRRLAWSADLSISEAGGLVAIYLLMIFASNGVLSNRYSASIILFFIFVSLASRNIKLIAATTLGLSLVCRCLFTEGQWPDQVWIQMYSESALVTGHGLYLKSPFVGMSMAAYMPMGDLFGGVLIALGIHKFWLVWHVIVCCLLAVPVVVSPGVTSLAIFVAAANILPFYEYTTRGGSLEIAFAVMIAAIAFYRAGYLKTSIVCFAFVACMRQPDALIVPFVLILLWRERDWKTIKLFAALLFLFGGVYILLDPVGFYLYAIKLFDLYNQMYFNEHQGLSQNYTISSIPHLFGVNDLVPWKQWSWIYMPILFLSLAGAFTAAWKSKSRDTVLTLGVMATLFVYTLVRGYSTYQYVVATALPFVALLPPRQQLSETRFRKGWAAGIAGVLFWFGLMPFVFYSWGKAADIADNFSRGRPAVVSQTRIVGSDGQAKSIPNLDGSNEHHTELLASQELEFTFAEPVILSKMRLVGDHVSVQEVKGMDIPWASEAEAFGAITEGQVEYSTDGTTFQWLCDISSNTTYSAFPVTFSLRRTTAPIKAIRLRSNSMYQDTKHWILGGVEFVQSK